MKKYQLVHQFEPKMRSQVRKALIDLHQFASFHALFKNVTRITPQNVQPAIYAIQEQVKILGMLPMRPKYNIGVTYDDDTVVYEARIMGLMNLKIIFSLCIDGSTLRLTEDVEVTYIPLLTWIFWDTFAPAHIALFAKMRGKYEDCA